MKKIGVVTHDTLCLISFFLLLLFATDISSAQIFGDDSDSDDLPENGDHKFFDPSRIVTGGNFGAGFTGTQSIINIAPMIGYRVTKEVTVGVTATYIYFQDNYYKYNTNIYGGSVFSDYRIFNNVLLHGEYEVLNFEVYDPVVNDFVRMNLVSILVGGGYRQSLGYHAYMNLLILWNLNETPYSPYRNPVIRMGFSVGI